MVMGPQAGDDTLALQFFEGLSDPLSVFGVHTPIVKQNWGCARVGRGERVSPIECQPPAGCVGLEMTLPEVQIWFS